MRYILALVLCSLASQCFAQATPSVSIISNKKVDTFADEQTTTETVNYTDLDLTTAAGLQAFRARFAAATHEVCAEAESFDRYNCEDWASRGIKTQMDAAIRAAKSVALRSSQTSITAR
jgi:UrcA family protein